MRTSPTVASGDPFGALRIGPELLIEGRPGPLGGERFVAKDVFDVAGIPVGAGSPDWLAEAAPAISNAPALDRLVSSGADLVGIAHTDELAYSLSGTNPHHGTPINPAARGRVPGGSSSGPAVAVAGGICEIGLGGDTGGSVRLPASYCGIWGMRPTHGRVPTSSMVPLAPSFDTVGWFAANPKLLARVGEVLLDPYPTPPQSPTELVVADDAFEILSPQDALAAAEAATALARRCGLVVSHASIGAPGDLELWADAYTVLQGREAWNIHGRWVSQPGRRMGRGVAARFRRASEITEADLARASAVAEAARSRLDKLLQGGRILALPAAPSGAPRPDMDTAAGATLRRNILRLTSPAGLGGLPSASCPLARSSGLPLGVCVVAPRGGDEGILDLLAASAP